MAYEIERKFLVTSDSYRSRAYDHSRITQGYLCYGQGVTVRVRVRGEQGFVTIKSPRRPGGFARHEWEYPIPKDEALEILQLCQQGVIDKTRYLVRQGRHVWEIDEFYGDNQGLVQAEVELGSEDEEFEKPDFVGLEVTGDKRYYNSYLTLHPYKTWDEESR